MLDRNNDNSSEEVIQALQDIQSLQGYISRENLKEISRNLGIAYSYTYAIATFYKTFSLKERGKYLIKVCDGTACHLKSSENIVDEINSYLGIRNGETTSDQMFTLEQVNCLGACAMAPVVSINEKIYGNLTRKKIRNIIDMLRGKK
ncbi:MAG: NAD(P)H-dependent oxidoreductase subunit E [Desulfobacterales bacterium]|nr:NAD(P)H-dependent oxidoreductase subunit E [Desulfobacterales bacterium]